MYDADLKGYFDSIPHDKLMKAVEFRIADRQVLHLIRLWLTAPIIEKDEQGRTTRTRPDKGTPQGGVISPLLSNLFLHWFDKVFHGRDGPRSFANARLIRYADDFVVMAKYVGNRIVSWVENKIETWMGLVINRDKTKVLEGKQPGKPLDFLGYSFRYDKDLCGRSHRYWNRIPTKKSMQKARDRIRELTSSRWCCLPVSEVVSRRNPSKNARKHVESFSARLVELLSQFWDIKTLAFRRYLCYNGVYGPLSPYLAYQV